MLLRVRPHGAFLATARSATHQAFTKPASSRPIISHRVTVSKILTAKMHIESASFTSSVVKAMRSLYPEEYADRTWDNVGLLLDNIGERAPRVLLTNDLTPDVADEAVRKDVSVVVTYHPLIFRPLKSITTRDPQQSILIELARHNIAIYSPHTALDAAAGGLNDWLADTIVKHASSKTLSCTRAVIQPVQAAGSPPPEGVGYGRIVRFDEPVAISDVVRRLADGLGGLKYVMVARPDGRSHTEDDRARTGEIRSAAFCAGSGWGVMKDCDADVYITGEMSHHEALRATMLGKWVVMVFHSNSERQFLKDRLRGQLEAQLASSDVKAEVLVSEADRDPFEVWDVERLDQHGGSS